MLGNGRVNDLPAVVGQNDHHVKQSKRQRCHNEHIDRGDAGGVIEQKAAPGRRRCTSSSHHVLSYRSLADLEAKLEELTMVRGVPQSGLALLISRISLRTSRSTDGRPDLERQRQ
jgi:hypothetical protein